MVNFDSLMKYYKEELKWNSPFAEVLSEYTPEALKGFLMMRQAVANGSLPKKYREMLFCILDSLDNEVSGSKSHAVAAVEAGLEVKELVEAFLILTIVKGINTLYMSGVKAIEAAEERYKELHSNPIEEDENKNEDE